MTHSTHYAGDGIYLFVRASGYATLKTGDMEMELSPRALRELGTILGERYGLNSYDTTIHDPRPFGGD